MENLAINETQVKYYGDKIFTIMHKMNTWDYAVLFEKEVFRIEKEKNIFVKEYNYAYSQDLNEFYLNLLYIDLKIKK
jgi:hypothetical protein